MFSWNDLFVTSWSQIILQYKSKTTDIPNNYTYY